jgi:hypothetical protein
MKSSKKKVRASYNHRMANFLNDKPVPDDTWKKLNDRYPGFLHLIETHEERLGCNVHKSKHPFDKYGAIVFVELGRGFPARLRDLAWSLATEAGIPIQYIGVCGRMQIIPGTSPNRIESVTLNGGPIEVSQDISDIKKLEGEKRLLDW